MKQLFFLFLLLFAPIFAHAAPVDEDGKRVFIALEAKGPAMAGETLETAIKVSILPGWHTYWLNAGDSGTPLMAKWTLPEGVEAGEQDWPTPKVIPYPPLVNYGYEGEMAILQPFTLPQSLPPIGEEITLSARFDVLVCDEICIPETHEASLTVPVSGPQTVLNAQFDAYRDALPRSVDWPASLTREGDQVRITITAPDAINWQGWDEARLFPEEWGMIQYAVAQAVTIDESSLTFAIAAGDRSPQDIGPSQIVIKASNGDALQVTATPQTPARTDNAEQTVTEQPLVDLPVPSSLWLLLIFAFLGGLILNLMPCVFPVLSIKALSLASHGAKPSSGLIYTAGVVASFLVLATIMLALRAGGEEIGWGFQLQSPVFILILTWVFFTIGLSLFGLFEVGRSVTGFGDKLTRGDGVGAQFMTGVLAVIVATPCTAPFMAASLGAALVLPVLDVVLIFVALGLGLAAPILLISLIPGAAKVLPKPGAWMERFKQFMAFPMWLSAIWLVWVLTRQSGPEGVLIALLGMTAIAFALWAKKRWVWVASMALLAAFTFAVPQMKATTQGPTQTGDAYPIESFTSAYYDQVIGDERPLFVEMTADWCITCKVNKRIALDRAETVRLFEGLNIRYVQGDWTHRDPEITNYLTRYGRAGVPLYVYYAKDGSEPVLLPQILTPALVAQAIDK